MNAEPPLPPPVPLPPHSPYPSCPAAVPSQMSRHSRLHAHAAPAPRCFATAALFATAPRGTAARQMPKALGIGPIKHFAAGCAMRAMRDCRKRARHRACRDIRGGAAAGLGSWGGGGGKEAACGLRSPQPAKPRLPLPAVPRQSLPDVQRAQGYATRYLRLSRSAIRLAHLLVPKIATAGQERLVQSLHICLWLRDKSGLYSRQGAEDRRTERRKGSTSRETGG